MRRLAESIGFEPVDGGPLVNARYLEPLGILNIWLGYVGRSGHEHRAAVGHRSVSCPYVCLRHRGFGTKRRMAGKDGRSVPPAAWVRFELTERFPVRRFSRPLHSTTLPPRLWSRLQS